MNDLGLPDKCQEYYADLEVGGAFQFCSLPRCHHGPHGVNVVRAETPTVQENNQRFDAFITDILSDMKTDQLPVGAHVIPEAL